jgi:acetyl esterase/lipase
MMREHASAVPRHTRAPGEGIRHERSCGQEVAIRFRGGGDPGVSPLMLWHICEEIEHRSSVLNIYNHVGAIHLFLVESLGYARRLTRAGVLVELHVWPGAYHAFGAHDAHVSREARRVARTAIRRALHGDPA